MSEVVCGRIVPVNVSSHPKVSNLGDTSQSFAGQQAIPSCDVPGRREKPFTTLTDVLSIHILTLSLAHVFFASIGGSMRETPTDAPLLDRKFHISMKLPRATWRPAQ